MALKRAEVGYVLHLYIIEIFKYTYVAYMLFGVWDGMGGGKDSRRDGGGNPEDHKKEGAMG